MPPPGVTRVTKPINGARRTQELRRTLNMKQAHREETPRDILSSHSWDFDITIHDAIVDFEKRTGVCVTEIRPIRKLSADGTPDLTVYDIYIAVQLPHRTR